MEIHLRDLQESDVDGMLEWMHDPETKKWFRYPMEKQTKADVLSFIQKARKTDKSEQGVSIHLAVADENDEYLGTISLKNIDYTSRNAEYAISIRQCTKGTGAAYKATKMLLAYAFDTLDLEKVYLNVLKENARAIAFYKKVGFKLEGESRKALYFNDKFHDLYWFSTLKEDWCTDTQEKQV
jgi:RimJ/RimL family protein N-acetyltransferase